MCNGRLHYDARQVSGTVSVVLPVEVRVLARPLPHVDLGGFVGVERDVTYCPAATCSKSIKFASKRCSSFLLSPRAGEGMFGGGLI